MTIVVASNAEYVGDLLQPGLVVGDLTGERHKATRRSPLRRAAPDKARALVGARRRSCRRRGLSLRAYSYFSTRTRILLSRPNAIITTPVVWIAMVTTMSDRPKIQLARFTSSLSVGLTGRRPHAREHS